MEIKIRIPDGYEIDIDNSTSKCVQLKPRKEYITYKEIRNSLFNGDVYYIDGFGKIKQTKAYYEDINTATNIKQLERLLALNQLLNIAEYYNSKNTTTVQYYIIYSQYSCKYEINAVNVNVVSYGIIPKFNRLEDAQVVIDNPNFRKILDTIYKD